MSVKLMIALLFISSFTAVAQEKKSSAEEEAAYTKVVTERAEKIVATLGITESQKSLRVRDIIANQYKNLNKIHNSRNEQVKQLKAAGTEDEAVKGQIKSLEDNATVALQKLHTEYLLALNKDLTPQQVEQVKDGMTYGVVNVTYKGYVDMIPSLTEPQKKQILSWLVEAREFAMDAESSEKKHWWFGKYKGRINNYLSAAGYDLKKEGQDWEKRRNSAKNTTSTN